MAFTMNKAIIMVYAVSSEGWKEGQVYLVVKELMKKYNPLNKKQAEENGNDGINSVAGEATDVALTRMTLNDKINSNNCIDHSRASCHF
jgi:hypothetical protein